jgi:hypothetical protein
MDIRLQERMDRFGNIGFSRFILPWRQVSIRHAGWSYPIKTCLKTAD